jgi:hypothetical protein
VSTPFSLYLYTKFNLLSCSLVPSSSKLHQTSEIFCLLLMRFSAVWIAQKSGDQMFVCWYFKLLIKTLPQMQSKSFQINFEKWSLTVCEKFEFLFCVNERFFFGFEFNVLSSDLVSRISNFYRSFGFYHLTTILFFFFCGLSARVEYNKLESFIFYAWITHKSFKILLRDLFRKNAIKLYMMLIADGAMIMEYLHLMNLFCEIWNSDCDQIWKFYGEIFVLI